LIRKKRLFIFLAMLMMISLISSSIAFANGNPSGASLQVTESGKTEGLNKLIVNKTVVGSDYEGPFSILINDEEYSIFEGENDNFGLAKGTYSLVENLGGTGFEASPSGAQNFSISEGVVSVWASVYNHTTNNMLDKGFWWVLKDDTVIGQGQFGPLVAGETFTLTYDITEAGNYTIDFDGEPSHPGTGGNGEAPVSGMKVDFTVSASDLVPDDIVIDITNTFEPTSTPKLIVEKTFVDYPDDVTKTATVTVSGGNDFSGSNTFTENGTWDVCEITSGETYTITEDSLTGVDFSFGSGQVTINDGSFTIPVSQTDDVTITVTNTYNPPSESNKLKIVKNFVNYADNDIAETADFSLMFTTPDPAETIGTHTFNGSGAAWTLYELTPGEYRLQESAVANVAVTFASTDVEIDENGVFLFPEDESANVTITVTNTYNPPLVYHSYLQIEKRLTGEVPDPEPTGFMARIEKWVDEVILRQIGGSWQTFMDNIALTAGQTTDPIEVDPYASYRVVEYQIGGADQVTYDLLNGDGIYDEISAEGVPIGENETRTIRVTNHYKGQSGGGGDSKKSYIKVSKNVTGDGPSGGYQVTIYGYEGYETEGEPAVVKTFTIRDGQTISTEVEPGVYSVQESAVDHSRFLGVDYTLNNDNYDPADTFVVGEDDTRSIVITNRFSTSGGGGDDPGSSGGGEESVVIPPEPPVVQPPVVQPPVVTPPLEPVIIPEVLPELPKTGASNILLTAMGLLLAGGGMILRRRS
ncbi:MAG: LPXTG cell wall anchor domain-containing protein, partial [Syntrophomonadaceae bacterium]